MSSRPAARVAAKSRSSPYSPGICSTLMVSIGATSSWTRVLDRGLSCGGSVITSRSITDGLVISSWRSVGVTTSYSRVSDFPNVTVESARDLEDCWISESLESLA